jgi:hypothetical protein
MCTSCAVDLVLCPGWLPESHWCQKSNSSFFSRTLNVAKIVLKYKGLLVSIIEMMPIAVISLYIFIKKLCHILKRNPHISFSLQACLKCFPILHSAVVVSPFPSEIGLDDRRIGVGVPVGSRIFTSSRRPDRLWGLRNILSNGYGGLFPGGKEAGVWSWPLTSN